MAQFARLKELIQLLPESERDEGLGLLEEAEKAHAEKQEFVKRRVRRVMGLKEENKKLKKDLEKEKDTIKCRTKGKFALTKENKKLTGELKKLKKDLEKEKGERIAFEEALGVYTETCEELEGELEEAQKSHEEEKRLRINVEKELEKEKENRTELVCLSNIGKGIDSKVIDTNWGGFRYQYKKTRIDEGDAAIAIPVATPVQ